MRFSADGFLVALTLMGLAALVGTSHAFAPLSLGMADAAAHEGARVVVEGWALEVHQGARGRALTVADDGGRLVVVASLGVPVVAGDFVRVVGVVSRLDGGIGISAEDVVVLARAASEARSVADVTRDPSLTAGTRVSVRGEWRDGMLVSGGGRVALSGAPVPDEAGMWLAAGTFRYRHGWAAYVLDVASWTRPS